MPSHKRDNVERTHQSFILSMAVMIVDFAGRTCESEKALAGAESTDIEKVIRDLPD